MRAAGPRCPLLFLTSKISRGTEGCQEAERGSGRAARRGTPVPPRWAGSGLLRRPREARRGRLRVAAGRRELPGRLQPPEPRPAAARRGELAAGRAGRSRAERGDRSGARGVNLVRASLSARLCGGLGVPRPVLRRVFDCGVSSRQERKKRKWRSREESARRELGGAAERSELLAGKRRSDPEGGTGFT